MFEIQLAATHNRLRLSLLTIAVYKEVVPVHATTFWGARWELPSKDKMTDSPAEVIDTGLRWTFVILKRLENGLDKEHQTYAFQYHTYGNTMPCKTTKRSGYIISFSSVVIFEKNMMRKTTKIVGSMS